MVRSAACWSAISGLTFISVMRKSDIHVGYELDIPTWIGPWDREADRPGYGYSKTLHTRAAMQATAHIFSDGVVCSVQSRTGSAARRSSRNTCRA